MFQLVVRLSEQQKGVLEDLFSSTMSIREVLEKRQIDRSEYCQWLEQELFVSKFNRMLELLRLESKLRVRAPSASLGKPLVERWLCLLAFFVLSQKTRFFRRKTIVYRHLIFRLSRSFF
jgi:hypothetical protein